MLAPFGAGDKMKKLPGAFWIALASALVAALIGFFRGEFGAELVWGPIAVIALEAIFKALEIAKDSIPMTDEFGRRKAVVTSTHSKFNRWFWG